MKIVGVDVGGTFIDVISIDNGTGQCRLVKRSTKRGEQARILLAAVLAAVDDIKDVEVIVHGTTIATNALIERTGAKTALITTKGFRDVLEMRRRDRKNIWGMSGDFEPLVPRALRFEVDERTLADGRVEAEVNEQQIEAAVSEMLRNGVEAVTICFLNSYICSDNEKRAAEIVRRKWPNAHVTASHEISGEIREFERTSTVVVNGYLQPMISGYIDRLEEKFTEGGYRKNIYITQSNGGIMLPSMARRIPMRTALSGPAAGVIAGKRIAEAAGYKNVIMCDMGGTSFDVSMLVDGRSVLKSEAQIDFGIVIRTPMLEISAIGAGGGSIASVDAGGLLRVGPASAGSYPGPACYDRGNSRPTVTDAHVVLRRIDAGKPIGEDTRGLDIAAAERAVEEHVAKPLKMSVHEAAEAIIRVANSNMASAIRIASIERGHDPKHFSGMFFGGAGALHCGALIQEVGLAQAIIPPFPGVTCALGCALADLQNDFVQTINQNLQNLDFAGLHDFVSSSFLSGTKALDAAADTIEQIELSVSLDMSYVGQTHTVAVQMDGIVDAEHPAVGVAKIRAKYDQTYKREYGRSLPDIAINVLAARVSVIGIRKQIPLRLAQAPEQRQIAEIGRRDVWIEGSWRSVPIYDRFSVPQKAVLTGPCILQQDDTTIYLDPNLVGTADPFGNFIITRP